MIHTKVSAMEPFVRSVNELFTEGVPMSAFIYSACGHCDGYLTAFDEPRTPDCLHNFCSNCTQDEVVRCSHCDTKSVDKDSFKPISVAYLFNCMKVAMPTRFRKAECQLCRSQSTEFVYCENCSSDGQAGILICLSCLPLTHDNGCHQEHVVVSKNNHVAYASYVLSRYGLCLTCMTVVKRQGHQADHPLVQLKAEDIDEGLKKLLNQRHVVNPNNGTHMSVIHDKIMPSCREQLKLKNAALKSLESEKARALQTFVNALDTFYKKKAVEVDEVFTDVESRIEDCQNFINAQHFSDRFNAANSNLKVFKIYDILKQLKAMPTYDEQDLARILTPLPSLDLELDMIESSLPEFEKLFLDTLLKEKSDEKPSIPKSEADTSESPPSEQKCHMTSKCNDASVDSGFSVDIVELSSDEDDVVESKTISATPNVTETPSTGSVVSRTHAPNTVESSTDMLRHVHLELMPRLASILSATPGLTTAENNISSSKRSSTATAEVSPKRPKLNSAPEPDGVITESRKDDTSQSCTKNQELTKTKSPRKQAQSRTCDTTLDQEMVTESTETTREFTAAEGVLRSNTCDSLAEKQDVPKTKSPEKRHEVSAKLPKTGKASEPGLSGVITSNAKENTAQSLAKNRELSNVNSPKKQGRPRNPVPETTTGMTNTTRNSADIEVAPSMRNICKSVAKKPEPTKANSPKKRGRPKKVDTRSDPVAEMATDPTEMTRERTAAELSSRYNILDIEYVYSEDEYVKLNTHDKFLAFWRTELVNVNPDKSCRKYVILLIAAKWKEFQPIIPVKKKTRVEIVESLLKKYKLKDANFVAKATEAQPVDMDTFRAQLKPKLRSLNPCADLQVLLRLIFYKYNVYRNRREFRPLVAQVLEKGAMKDCDCSFDKATCLAQISFQDFLAHVRPRLVAANPTTGDEHIRQLVAAKWRQFKKDRRVLPKIPFHSAVPVEKLSGELVPSKFTEAGERPKIKKEWIGEICEMCSLFEPPSRLKKDKPGVSDPSSFIDWATCDLCDKWFHRDCLIQPTAKNHRDVYVLDAAGKVTKYFCSDCAPRNE